MAAEWTAGTATDIYVEEKDRYCKHIFTVVT
jgi:hypothetical protein